MCPAPCVFSLADNRQRSFDSGDFLCFVVYANKGAGIIRPNRLYPMDSGEEMKGRCICTSYWFYGIQHPAMAITTRTFRYMVQNRLFDFTLITHGTVMIMLSSSDIPDTSWGSIWQSASDIAEC